MQLVILAAGHGRRFGGLKQLAPVGPHGEAIMDFTVASAKRLGYEGVVVVVRDEIRDEILAHTRRAWPAGLEVTLVCQPPRPGTAEALLSAKAAIEGPFGVANADDLYGESALWELRQHFAAGNERPPHLVVGYHLTRTVLTEDPVTRALCEVDEEGRLRAIVEHVVTLREDGCFEARPLPGLGPEGDVTSGQVRLLSGDELVSMNLWGFHPRIFGHLEHALANFDPSTAARPELLIADVVGELVRSGSDAVEVAETSERCIGVTHPSDIALVRDEVALDPSGRNELDLNRR